MRFIRVKQSARSTWWISLEGNGCYRKILNTEHRVYKQWFSRFTQVNSLLLMALQWMFLHGGCLSWWCLKV